MPGHPREMPPRWWQYVDPLPELLDEPEPPRRRRRPPDRGPRRSTGRLKKAIGWLVVAFVALAVIGSAATSKHTVSVSPPRTPLVTVASPVALPPPTTPAADATITKCSEQAPGFVQAVGVVTNRGVVPRDFLLHVEFLDASGVRVAEGFGSQSQLSAGETAQWVATGMVPAGSTVTSCRVVGVN